MSRTFIPFTPNIQKTRAERRLPPYESPKKPWDIHEATTTVEVIEAATSSQRHYRRTRRRSFDANQRRATRQMRNTQFGSEHERQNAAGLARIYFNHDGAAERNPVAMWKNTTAAVHHTAQAVAEERDITLEAGFKVVEGALLDLLPKPEEKTAPTRSQARKAFRRFRRAEPQPGWGR